MILVTGGLGFIGLHTARALLDLGETCVLTQYRVAREPDFIKDEVGKRVFIEQLDVTDTESFMAIGKKHHIDGIVHLAVPGLGALSPADDFRVNMNGLLNALQAAQDWEVKRIGIASSLAVYSGVRELPYREDMPLPMTGGNPTEAFKKSYEILGTHFAGRTGIDLVNLRIAGIWGPLYHSMANLPSKLVHAAVKGEKPNLEGPRGVPYAEDGGDMCYVKDCGRGIALLQVAEKLNHRTYNIASGRATRNEDLVAAVHKVLPDAELELPAGHAPNSPGEVPYLDLSWIHEDTGFEPQYSTESGIADYVGWLQAGNAE
ncbi:MAG TPA: NAD(P)-dependent oxidoreductase [Acidimicrobiales bacterium]|nr:NAD(P)-dependent oxidoreductase [Acidimicrobiales bacterium]